MQKFNVGYLGEDHLILECFVINGYQIKEHKEAQSSFVIFGHSASFCCGFSVRLEQLQEKSMKENNSLGESETHVP